MITPIREKDEADYGESKDDSPPKKETPMGTVHDSVRQCIRGLRGHIRPKSSRLFK